MDNIINEKNNDNLDVSTKDNDKKEVNCISIQEINLCTQDSLDILSSEQKQSKINEIDITSEENEENEEIITLTDNEDDSKGINSQLKIDCSSSDDIVFIEKNQDDFTPDIKITFNDNSIKNKYYDKFLKFLHNFIEFNIIPNDLYIDVCKDNNINSDEWVIINEYPDIDILCDDSSSTSSSTKKRKKHSKVKRELFVVDATPSDDSVTSNLRYSSKFVINDNENKEIKSPQIIKNKCFNCDKDHYLRDCPLPKDFDRINLAKKNFSSKFIGSKSRYHLDDGPFSHLKPGILSDDLCRALGLRKKELPPYIYKMRKLGYPPGWLEEAKVCPSNLEIFDIDGKGIKSKKRKRSGGLDPEKIIDYPGFNIPIDRSIKDEFRKYGVPCYSDNYSKEAMINYFNYECIEIQDDDDDTIKDNSDMDMDTTEEESLPIETKEDTLALDDLEQKKKELIDKLNETQEVAKTVKTSFFGTPILKSSSPYDTIPARDNFSKNVSPLINFENLPNTTGRYEQINDVLQKVRIILKETKTDD